MEESKEKVYKISQEYANAILRLLAFAGGDRHREEHAYCTEESFELLEKLVVVHNIRK